MEKASGILAKFLLLLCLSLFGSIQRAEGDFTEERFCPHDTEQLHIPAGVFTMGSTSEEREYAYRLDKEVTRPYGWYEKETRKKAKTDSFCIDRYPTTSSRDFWYTPTRRSRSFYGGRALSLQTVRTTPSFW
jgi:hypothetical protein